MAKYGEPPAALPPSRNLRAGRVELDRSTLADWVGRAASLLEPLVEALRRDVMGSAKLHADDTPMPVLDPAGGGHEFADRGRGPAARR